MRVTAPIMCLMLDSHRGQPVVFLTVFTVALVIAHTALAQEDRLSATASLRGLPGVAVGVPNDVAALGLSSIDMRTAIEVKLRLAGIKILDAEEALSTPSAPALGLWLRTIDAGEFTVVSMRLELRQRATLATGAKDLLPTWDTNWTLLLPTRDASANVRDSIQRYVERFVNAWLTVNPR